MNIITRMRKQKCVYWALSSKNQFGEKQYDSPVEISCRWEDSSVEYLNSDGERVVSNAVVYVDRDVFVGSILMLGVLADITDYTYIKENVGAYEIQKFEKLPNFKTTEFLRTVYL